jgi:choice-of-anchor A domain-containing protein
MQTIPYDPFAVRFLAGGDVNIAGALTVVGNVVGDGSFQAGTGSTYLIGKSDNPEQKAELAALYAGNGSPYWSPQDEGSHYIISSYDTPRYIPAPRLSADVPAFFAAAGRSLACRMENMAALQANGSAVWEENRLLLIGSDPLQNVFDVAWDEALTGALAIDTPENSLNIVRIRSGENLRIGNGLWGSEGQAEHTLYVLMDARSVDMPVATAIYGSVLAPFTLWNANRSGGNINGNAALAGLNVPRGSGFELHWYPFAGGMQGLGDCTVQPDTSVEEETQTGPEQTVCCGAGGIVSGVMLPTGHCQWRLKLQLLESRQVLSVWQGCGMAAFSFEADPRQDYLLLAETCCHYEIRLTAAGVRSLTLRG